MTDFIKTFLLPGSKWFLLVGLSAGVVMLYGPRPIRRWARAWLLVLAAGFWLLTLPAFSDRLAGRFSANGQPMPDPEVSRAAAIIVLGSGVETFAAGSAIETVPLEQTALNAFEGAAVYRVRPVPVIVSGGVPDPESKSTPESEILRDLLIRSGVPDTEIISESESRTTHEQAVNVQKILESRRWKPAVLVTSPVHLLRAAATFRAAGVDVIPVRAAYRSNQRRLSPLVPATSAIKAGEMAIYDYIGLLYYWVRGWTARDR